MADPVYIRQNTQMVKGDELWLFVGVRSAQDTEVTPVPICFATQASINRSLNTTSVSSKDHGTTSYTIPGEGSWTASTEALMSITTNDSGANAFSTLMDAFTQGYFVDVTFGKISNFVGTGIVDVDAATDWTMGTPYWKGKGYITSLQASGGHGDSATFSIEISGVGPLTKVTA